MINIRDEIAGMRPADLIVVLGARIEADRETIARLTSELDAAIAELQEVKKERDLFRERVAELRSVEQR